MMKKNKNEFIVDNGIYLSKYVKGKIEKNKMKILHDAHILNKTCTMIDAILSTPRNLLQPNSPILTEALENKKCQKEFKKSQKRVKRIKKDDLPPFMYDILTNLKYDEPSIIEIIAIAQQERENLIKVIQKDTVFEIAKSIWLLRALTTSIVYYVDASFAFFKETELLDMYKFLRLAVESYATQVMKIESLILEDEEEN